MPFASGLRESLQFRDRQVLPEITRGDSLEHVLDRHLLAVERMAQGSLITSILLLSLDGKRLSHGAAPNLPHEFREAIDGVEIGPEAGSCGTAAYFGKPVYVSDIAMDPLWDEYRHLALPHGLRSCWSTPIFDVDGSVIGTFAIYHREPGDPSQEEIDAIRLITRLVANAILWARGEQDLEEFAQMDQAPLQGLPADGVAAQDGDVQWPRRLLRNVERLEMITSDLDRHAQEADSHEARGALRRAADDCRQLSATIRRQIEMTGKALQ